jgi:uncharacterized protein (TIGR03067 family)
MGAKIACVFLATLLPLATGRPDQPPLKKEFTPLQGTWKLASLEVDGKFPDVVSGIPRWVIRGNKVFYAGKELATLTLDASTKPHSIDLGFLSPKRVYEGVYEVDGDTLKICVNRQTDGVKERPLGFTTKDKRNLRLLVFKRVKGADKGAPEDLAGFVGMAIRYSADRKEVVVSEALDGSPAKKAGLKKDDVLISVGGQPATDLHTVIDRVRQEKPGSRVVLRVRRSGKEQDITVTAGVVPFFLLD